MSVLAIDTSRIPFLGSRDACYGSGTPRPKTISARDSSAQINFFTGTPRPGTPRPSYKNTLFVAYNGKQMYI